VNAATRVLGAQLRNLARSRWMLGYVALLALATTLLLRLGGGGERALLSLLNVVLLLLPLVSVVFGTLYIHNARQFIELLLAQPVGRGALYAGLFGGLALPLGAAFLLGVGVPLLLQGGGPGYLGQAALLLAVGFLLTLVFSALAVALAVRFDDRTRALGAGLLLWLVAALLYDGLILLVVSLFSDYPLEGPLLAMVFLNPVDLARVLLLFALDLSALMGYTGAVYERFFQPGPGAALAFLMLLVSAVAPFLLGWRWFRRKDF
jgi:Cu-processing system permease protein